MTVTYPKRGILTFDQLNKRHSIDVIVDVNGTLRDTAGFKREWMPKLLGRNPPEGMPVTRQIYASMGRNFELGWMYWSAHLHEIPEFLDAEEIPCAFAELEKLREAGYRLHPTTSNANAQSDSFYDWVERKGHSTYEGMPLFEPLIATNGRPKHEATAHLHPAAAIDDTLRKVEGIDAPKYILDTSRSKPLETSYGTICPGWRWNCKGTIGNEIISRSYER